MINKEMINYELEHDVQNEIRIWCGEHKLLAFRANVIKGYSPDGRWITSGLPEGFPDVIVLTNTGQTIYVECKTLKGKARDAQKRLHKILKEMGHVVLMPRSLEQFIKEITPYIKTKEINHGEEEN